ncbi:uncharacterized protein BBOV_IV000415 [Babesia bovis T2Bo]|uniref:Golgi apparatus membrane protein TVP23 homolog n=1 Tax=Babesia bovis TaxID=5865 RepID=S6B0Z9_BABBO|nr:uncharacterized protein BBOV_IV000415 [Babesia bovis T2Bo]KAG6439908.1 hypothetical protein BBOV_IV000415 [Babesia bovis T2Bo]BAN65023.1 protein fam18b1-like [Babesia bovis]
MQDELTGSINELRSSKNASAVFANFVTSVMLLPHPWTCLAHIGLKIAIVISYFIMPYVLGYIVGTYPDYVFTFELTALMAFADFWIVKNHTANNLAGITWYTDNTNVKQVFVHKATKDEMFLHKEESNFFWTVIYIWPVPWAWNLLYKLSILDIPMVTLSAVILIFALLNLFNCLKCSQEKRSQTSQMAGQLSSKLFSLAAWSYRSAATIPQ